MYKNVCSPEGNNKVLSTNVRLYIYPYALYISFRNKINLKFDTLDSFCTKISLIGKHINISQKKTDIMLHLKMVKSISGARERLTQYASLLNIQL